MERKHKIIVFWILTICGFLALTITDAMPAFWGESIAAMQPPTSTGMIAFMMTISLLHIALGFDYFNADKGMFKMYDKNSEVFMKIKVSF